MDTVAGLNVGVAPRIVADCERLEVLPDECSGGGPIFGGADEYVGYAKSNKSLGWSFSTREVGN